MSPAEIKNILEFALLASGGPLDLADFRRLVDDGGDGDIRDALAMLEREWEGRGLRLAKVADGWQLVSREGYLEYLRRLRPKKPARLSRQLMEVLAVIAYRQPATRGDIEQVRGVSVSSMQLAALEELGWIEEIGRRETPGRPILYGTTKGFLNDLAIASLEELPALAPEDIQGGFEDAEDSRTGDDSNLTPPTEDSAESGNSSAAESESDTQSESRTESESEQKLEEGRDDGGGKTGG